MVETPEVTPYACTIMYMQRNGPGAIPGCPNFTNGDSRFGGKVISSTGGLHDTIATIDEHINQPLQDHSIRPDRQQNRPPIYVSVKGIDLADHAMFMDFDKRYRTEMRGGITLKHPIIAGPILAGEEHPKTDPHAFIYLDAHALKS